MLPVFLTQTIILFQDTSLVYAIGAYDLLKGFETAGRTWVGQWRRIYWPLWFISLCVWHCRTRCGAYSLKVQIIR